MTLCEQYLFEYVLYYLQVECSADQQFPDTFTVQKVAEDDVQRFNYVACMVPFVRDLITDVSYVMHGRNKNNVLFLLTLSCLAIMVGRIWDCMLKFYKKYSVE